MVSMNVMEMTIDQIIDVVSMGNRLMSTPRTMDMARFMTIALMGRGASRGVLLGNRNHVLVHVVPMG